MDVSVTLKLKDELTKPLQRAREKLGSNAAKVEKLNRLMARVDSKSVKMAQVADRVLRAEKAAKLGGIVDRIESKTIKMGGLADRALRAQGGGVGRVFSKVGRNADSASRATDRLSRKTEALAKIKEGLANQEQRWFDRSQQQSRAQERYIKAQKSMKGATMTSAAVAGVGAAGVYTGRNLASGVMGLTDAVRPESKALAELASMGVKRLDLMKAEGRKMQSEFAGITTDLYQAAAYNVKSGISSLNDQGVAAYTTTSGLMAKATKSNIDTMTRASVTGFGIFREQFADISDLEFGRRFGASVVGAVQKHSLTGGKIEQAISSGGAVATLMGQKQNETLSIYGMLGQTISGGDAGTANRAFAENAGAAHERFAKLATATKNPVVVRVLDKEGMLRKIPDILDDIKARYGETLNGFAQNELKTALGSTEAVKLITLLHNKQDALRENVAELDKLALKGDKYSRSVANIVGNNYDDKIIRQQQKWALLRMELGERLIPMIERMMPYIDRGIDKMRRWTAEHPQLVKWLGMGAMALGTLSIVGGGLLLTLAPLILGFYSTRLAMAALGLKGGVVKRSLSGLWAVLKFGGRGLMFLGAKALPLVLTGIRAVGIATMANPIGLTIMAIAGGAYLIYRNWDKIHKWWATTTWKQKAIDVSMMVNPLGLFWRTAKTTWQWWASTTWGKKSIEVGTELLAKVGIDTKQVLNWWNNTTWQKKALDIGSAPIELVHSLALDFVNWWNGISLKSLVPDIKMPDISGAWGKFKATIGIKGDAGDVPKYGGARATGGTVMPGSFYRVNEHGAELVTMGSDTYLMAGKRGHVTPLIGRLPSRPMAANDPKINNQGMGARAAGAVLGMALAMPAAATIPDVSALAGYRTQSPAVTALPDIHGTGRYGVQSPNAATMPDVSALAGYRTQSPAVAALPDIHGTGRYSIQSPTVAVLPDIHGAGRYGVQSPNAATMPDVSALAGYRTQSPAVTALPDIHGTGRYGVQSPNAAIIPDVSALAGYRTQSPAVAALSDIHGTGRYGVQSPAVAALSDVSALVGYRTQSPAVAELPDIHGTGRYGVQPPAVASLPNMRGVDGYDMHSPDAPPRTVQVAKPPPINRSSDGSDSGATHHHHQHNETFTFHFNVSGGGNAEETAREVAKQVEKTIKKMQRRGAVKARSSMHDGKS